jgi:hypothetical protein
MLHLSFTRAKVTKEGRMTEGFGFIVFFGEGVLD